MLSRSACLLLFEITFHSANSDQEPFVLSSVVGYGMQ